MDAQFESAALDGSPRPMADGWRHRDKDQQLWIYDIGTARQADRSIQIRRLDNLTGPPTAVG